jgi:hypothetical protein
MTTQTVDLRRQFDKACRVNKRLEFPGQIVWVDWNTLSTLARAWQEAHETEGLFRVTIRLETTGFKFHPRFLQTDGHRVQRSCE